jgi:hypothetical protein
VTLVKTKVPLIIISILLLPEIGISLVRSTSKTTSLNSNSSFTVLMTQPMRSSHQNPQRKEMIQEKQKVSLGR